MSAPAASAARRVWVVKPSHAQQVQQARLDKTWTFPSRNTDIQPHEVLLRALQDDVECVLVFSVTGSSAFQGWARVVGVESVGGDGDDDGVDDSGVSGVKVQLEWVDEDEVDEVAFSETAHLVNSTGEEKVPVNRSRNFAELDQEAASEVLTLLQQARQRKEQQQQAQQRQQEQHDDGDDDDKEKDDAFYALPEAEVEASEPGCLFWRVARKVEAELGAVLFGCVVGSRRYNLQVVGSDTDLLIVYAAPPHDLVGLASQRAPACVKNPPSVKPDLTVLEVGAFAELLAAGDPRIVESLHVPAEHAFYISPAFAVLFNHRRQFVSQRVVLKLLSDAGGSRGLRRLRKISNPAAHAKVGKMWYIVMRLLNQAEALVDSGGARFPVWLDETDPVRQRIMALRQTELLEEIEHSALLTEFCGLADRLATRTGEVQEVDAEEAEAWLQKWLVSLRLQDDGVLQFAQRSACLSELRFSPWSIPDEGHLVQQLQRDFALFHGDRCKLHFVAYDAPIRISKVGEHGQWRRVVTAVYTSSLAACAEHEVVAAVAARDKRGTDGSAGWGLSEDAPRHYAGVEVEYVEASEFLKSVVRGDPTQLLLLERGETLVVSSEWRALCERFLPHSVLDALLSWPECRLRMLGQSLGQMQRVRKRVEKTKQKRLSYYDRSCLATALQWIMRGGDDVHDVAIAVLDGSLCASAALSACEAAGGADMRKEAQRERKAQSKSDRAAREELVGALVEPLNAWLARQRGAVGKSGGGVRGAGDAELVALLKKIGLDLPPEQVLLVAQSGSALFDLAVETSDVDYFVVFAAPAGEVYGVGQVKRMFQDHTTADTMDKAGVVEVLALEAERFVDNLLKGNPKYLEVLFVGEERLAWVSDEWRWLTARRDAFLSRRAVAQYIGFVKDRVRSLGKPQRVQGMESKLFYHAYHKLFDLERLVRGEPPKVKSSGEERDFIMAVRKGDVDGDEAEVTDRLQKCRDVARAWKEDPGGAVWPQEADERVVIEWLGLVRGV